MGFTCEVCHQCGGNYAFGNYTFAGGTTTANGTMTLNGLSTTCSVGCHNPLGATVQSVAWNAGPLQCTSCHNNLLASGTVRSSHFADVTSANGACQGCHDQSQHTQGQVRLWTGDGSIDSSCNACHSGQGQMIGDKTPPLLVGWTDTLNGDFHGARAGTGAGGTLLAPYVRGQPALPCTSCHDPHASTNAFLFASTVNGNSPPAGTISRSGVGAEALCESCHQGDRHALCKQCHTVSKMWDAYSGQWIFDPSSGPADPEPPGSPCFWCHGHEGIVNWPPAANVSMTGNTLTNPKCTHCHGYSQIANTAQPPIIQQGKLSGGGLASPPAWFPNPQVWLALNGNVINLTKTSASIWWETDESATTFVEWGIDVPNTIAGYDTTPVATSPYPYGTWSPNVYQPVLYHRVDLTGLTPGTTYVWRIRTSDPLRNVTLTPLQTFTTPTGDPPPTPVPVHEPIQYNANSGGAEVLTYAVNPPLTWSAVAGPNGDPVTYRAMLASDPGFTQNVVDSGWISGTSYRGNVTGYIGTSIYYYWRVMAKDTVTGMQSPWSSVDQFIVAVGDPSSDY